MENDTITSPEEFEKVVRSRRSVRIFESEAIPEEVVQKCLELTLLAPNSSNMQPWEFWRIRNAETKKQLAACCFGQPAATTAAELIVCLARTKTWQQNCQRMLEVLKKAGDKVPKSALHYYEKLVPFAYNQGPLGLFGLAKKVILFFRGLVKVTPREPTSHSQMKLWAAKSTALACENMMLAFRAYGYDSCPMEGYDSKRVRKLLKLPKDAYLVMIIAAGKGSPKGVYGPQVRFDRNLFIKEI